MKFDLKKVELKFYHAKDGTPMVKLDFYEEDGVTTLFDTECDAATIRVNFDQNVGKSN